MTRDSFAGLALEGWLAIAWQIDHGMMPKPADIAAVLRRGDQTVPAHVQEYIADLLDGIDDGSTTRRLRKAERERAADYLRWLQARDLIEHVNRWRTDFRDEGVHDFLQRAYQAVADERGWAGAATTERLYKRAVRVLRDPRTTTGRRIRVTKKNLKSVT